MWKTMTAIAKKTTTQSTTTTKPPGTSPASQQQQSRCYDVIIVGAGAAGLTAAYELTNSGLNVALLEASPTRFGGRVKKYNDATFAPFPIDLGGEWIQSNNPKHLLNTIVGQNVVKPNETKKKGTSFLLSGSCSGGGHSQHHGPTIEIIKYDSNPYYEYDRKRKKFYKEHLSTGTEDDPLEYKFVNYTWYDFFNDYIVTPKVRDSIFLNHVVNVIDYSNTSGENMNTIIVRCKNGSTFHASRIVVAVPLQIMKDNVITFLPSLPENKQKAFRQISPMPPGIKVFLKFHTKFYSYDRFGISSDENEECNERYFYNVSEIYQQNQQDTTSADNILGVFAVGKAANAYLQYKKDRTVEKYEQDELIIAHIMDELDTMFGGNGKNGNNEIATNSFTGQYVIQDWTQEEYVRGAYSHLRNRDYKQLKQIVQPITVGRGNDNSDDDDSSSSSSTDSDENRLKVKLKKQTKKFLQWQQQRQQQQSQEKRNGGNVKQQIYFAGEYLPIDYNNGYVHSAALSGKNAAKQIIEQMKG